MVQEPTYMGHSWASLTKLADAVLVVEESGKLHRLPIHTSQLAKCSEVLLTAIVSHREQPG